MHRGERGVVLLDVMVAFTILSAAGLSAIGLLAAAERAEGALRRREVEMRGAERLLAAASLLSRGDLDLRLGRHAMGEYVLDVQRPERELYRLAVGPGGSARVELLVTVVYRPDRRNP